jgi:hypothetical protein
MYLVCTEGTLANVGLEDEVPERLMVADLTECLCLTECEAWALPTGAVSARLICFLLM